MASRACFSLLTKKFAHFPLLFARESTHFARFSLTNSFLVFPRAFAHERCERERNFINTAINHSCARGIHRRGVFFENTRKRASERRVHTHGGKNRGAGPSNERERDEELERLARFVCRGKRSFSFVAVVVGRGGFLIIFPAEFARGFLLSLSLSLSFVRRILKSYLSRGARLR